MQHVKQWNNISKANVLHERNKSGERTCQAKTCSTWAVLSSGVRTAVRKQQRYHLSSQHVRVRVYCLAPAPLIGKQRKNGKFAIRLTVSLINQHFNVKLRRWLRIRRTYPLGAHTPRLSSQWPVKSEPQLSTNRSIDERQNFRHHQCLSLQLLYKRI